MRIFLMTLLGLFAPSVALAAGFGSPTLRVGYGLTAKYAIVHEVGNKTVDMREINQEAPPLFNLDLTPQASPKFPGVSQFDRPICASTCEFADIGVAASPKWIVEGAGSGFAVYSTTGHLAPGWPKAAKSLFQIPNPCEPDQPDILEPRAFYDPNDHRFWASVISEQTEPCQFQSFFWIAVSQTNDPRGAWNVYTINGQLPGFGDGLIQSNELGFDGQAVYFGGSFSDSNNSVMEMFFASKALMESGQPINPSLFYNFASPAEIYNEIQPVETETPSGHAPGVEYLINTDYPAGGCQVVCKDIVVWAIANPLTNPTLSGYTLTTFHKYSTPPSITEPFYNVGAPGTGIGATPVYTASRGGGLIAFSLMTGGGSEPMAPGVLWGEVHPTIDTSGTLTNVSEYQAGYLRQGGGIGTFYPAVMASNDGSLWIVADQSGPSLYARTIVGVQRPTDPLGRFENIHELKRGNSADGSGELGLYNAASVDGLTSGQSHVWLSGQYIIRSLWATYLGRDI